MEEVQIIKASKDKVIRNGAISYEKIRVAPYCRVSTDSDEQKNSYESQKKYYQELILKKTEWELVDIYADEAISGIQVYKRNDFQRMINDAMDGKIDMIITKSISRFARNTLDTLSYVRKLKDKGIAIFFEKENINTLTMNGELLLVILSSLAQQESESIGGNVKLGLKMKMSRGEMVGFNRCLGYNYDKETKELSIIPEEAEIVRYIFRRYTEGIGTYALAKELERKGFKNIRGEVKWRDGTVAGILKNEKYKGDLLQGKTFTVDSISHKRLSNQGESDKYYLTNHHEPIVSREIWDKAQEIRKNRNRVIGVVDNRRTKSRQHAFSCMIECAYCGSHFIRRTWHSSSKNEKRVWSCIKRTNTGRKYCPDSDSIEEKILEKAFVEAYNMMIDTSKEIIESLTNTISKIILEEFDDTLVESKQKEIAVIDKKISNLLDLSLDSKIERSVLENKMDELVNKKASLEKQLEKLLEQKEHQSNYNDRIDKIKSKINSLSKLEYFDREVFECVISKIIIGKVSESEKKYPLHITFVFKTGDEVSGYTKSTKKKNVIDKYIDNESNGNVRNNECLNIQCDTNDMCSNIEYDAY